MAHMKLKKVSKKSSFKLLILLIIIYLSFIYTFYYSFKNISNNTNKSFILYLLNNNAIMRESTYDFPKIINNSFNYILKIDFTNPSSLFNQSIIGYNLEEDNNIDLDELKKVSSYISDPSKKVIDKPLIYLYNTHQLENYNSDTLSKFGITPNVLMMSYLLKEKLNNMGIPTIVEDTNITDFLSLNNWDYANSYKASRIFMLDKQNTYPSLKYYIDLHRDSVTHNLTTVRINNKNYARILFVIGLEHNNYKKNLEFSEKLNNLFDKYYPGLSRGIYKKEGPNVNGIYNQDISPYVTLIEVGGVDNNMNEVMNTVNAISDIMAKYMGEYDKK